MPILAGIDYSLSCPAICIYDTEKGDFCYNNVKAYFRSNLARFEMFQEGNLNGCNHGPWKDVCHAGYDFGRSRPLAREISHVLCDALPRLPIFASQSCRRRLR